MGAKVKGIIYRENEKHLARVVCKSDFNGKRLNWKFRLFAGTIIKIFDNRILDRLPEDKKKLIAPLVNAIIAELPEDKE